MRPNYIYNAYIISVYDGDTIRADIDLGFGLEISGKSQSLRLHRINTPEIRGEEKEAGIVSRDYVKDKVLNKNIIIQTIKDKKGKYGRYLAEIYYINEEGNQINLNDELVEKGLATYTNY